MLGVQSTDFNIIYIGLDIGFILSFIINFIMNFIMDAYRLGENVKI